MSALPPKYVKPKQINASKSGGGIDALPDADFDGKDPREVIELMGRAKRWLESRGYTIRLDGEYTKTTVYKLKF